MGITLLQAMKQCWSAPVFDLAKYLEEAITTSKQEVSLLKGMDPVEKLLAEQHLISKFYAWISLREDSQIYP